MKAIYFIFFCLLSCAISAQETVQVGLLYNDEAQTHPGYNLLYPHNQPDVWLLDNCGRVVHNWPGEEGSQPGNTAYIRENGDLLKTFRIGGGPSDPIWAGGAGQGIELRNWDNELLWTYVLADSTARLHHDIEPLPNGNVLAIAWEVMTQEEALAAGRRPDMLGDSVLWPEMILEIEPLTSEIVWEWHVRDHLIQDRDATLENFGNVGQNPGRIDINYGLGSDGVADWLHANALDYNAGLDQIVISIPRFDEIWIIDHSTTSAEAAGSTGGNAGRGGELLYRWGNPAAYRRGTPNNQQLFYQHDVQWTDDHLPESDPRYGMLTIFNNRLDGSTRSAGQLLAPVFDTIAQVYEMIGNTFAPAAFEATYAHPEVNKTFSTGLSGIQPLPNGNTLICVGRTGLTFELNPAGEVVWEYKTPFNGGVRQPVETGLPLINNTTFRVPRYAEDYAGFAGRDLEPGEYLAFDDNALACQTVGVEEEADLAATIILVPNPTTGLVTLTAPMEWGSRPLRVTVYNALGRLVLEPNNDTSNSAGGQFQLDLSRLPGGIYVVAVEGRSVGRVVKR